MQKTAKNHKNSDAPLYRIRSADTGYFLYRRWNQKQCSVWDAYKPTKHGKSQLPGEFFTFLKRSIEEGNRRLDDIKKVVGDVGRKLGFEVFSEERSGRPRLVLWVAKREDGSGKLDVVAAFGILHGRWKEEERKRKETRFLRHCKAWLRFVVDNSTRYPITGLKKRSLNSWKRDLGYQKIQERMAVLDSLVKGESPSPKKETHSKRITSLEENVWRNNKLRFPRLSGITDAVRQRERLIWRTYNRLRPSRKTWGGTRNYDVYKLKNKNFGHHAQIHFLLLARELKKRKIDPIHYMKVMCQYRRHNRTFLPPPSWLAGEKALGQYEQLHYAQANYADREEEWQRLRGTFRAQDILYAIEKAGEFIVGAKKNFKMTEAEAVTAFVWELTPWFVTTYICSAPKKYADLVAQLARTNKETHADIQACLKFFVHNKTIWRNAKKVLLRVLE